MSSLPPSNMTVQLLGELLLLDQLTRNRLVKHLPEGVEMSQFLVLLHLATSETEMGPARLASIFNVTRGAMSNTLGRLERNGQITVRGDTVDARRKFVTVSEDGQNTLDQVVVAMQPYFEEVIKARGRGEVTGAVEVLAALRDNLSRG